MNIEEAKANIGAEVVLLEDTKPYTNTFVEFKGNQLEERFTIKMELKILTCEHGLVLIGNHGGEAVYIHPHHIALKEPKMQNYKIKVANEVESKEAQELFFELGYSWKGKKKISTSSMKCIFATTAGRLFRLDQVVWFDEQKGVEITLPQLRDLVVLHRNDVSDATHKSDFVGHKFFVASNGKAYEFNENKWQPKMCKAFLEPITQEEQMTWQDALRAVADGKEVEFRGYTGEWEEVIHLALHNVVGSDFIFRLTPQRKELNGNFTKEELLKIAGEMV